MDGKKMYLKLVTTVHLEQSIFVTSKFRQKCNNYKLLLPNLKINVSGHAFSTITVLYKRWFVNKRRLKWGKKVSASQKSHSRNSLFFVYVWPPVILFIPQNKKIYIILILICPQCPFRDPSINYGIRGRPETKVTCPSMLYYPLPWSGWSMYPAESWDKLVSGTACFGYTTSVCIVRAGTIQWQPNWLSCLVSR